MVSGDSFHTRPLVYLAGPYTHPDPVVNTHRAIVTAAHLMVDAPLTVVVPHLTMLWHLVHPQPLDWWYSYDLALLARCDALLRIEGASTGADAEVEFAHLRGIPVLHGVEAARGWARSRAEAAS